MEVLREALTEFDRSSEQRASALARVAGLEEELAASRGREALLAAERERLAARTEELAGQLSESEARTKQLGASVQSLHSQLKAAQTTLQQTQQALQAKAAAFDAMERLALDASLVAIRETSGRFKARTCSNAAGECKSLPCEALHEDEALEVRLVESAAGMAERSRDYRYSNPGTMWRTIREGRARSSFFYR